MPWQWYLQHPEANRYLETTPINEINKGKDIIILKIMERLSILKM